MCGHTRARPRMFGGRIFLGPVVDAHRQFNLKDLLQKKRSTKREKNPSLHPQNPSPGRVILAASLVSDGLFRCREVGSTGRVPE